MTSVENCSCSSRMVVAPTSTGTIRPSAVSAGRDRSTVPPSRCSNSLGVAVQGGAGVHHGLETLKVSSPQVADGDGVLPAPDVFAARQFPLPWSQAHIRMS